MKNFAQLRMAAFAVSSLTLLTACPLVGQTEPEICRGEACNEAELANGTMVNQSALEDCTQHGCTNGCVQLDYGVDEDASGALESREIDGTKYVCHGTNGLNGTNGANGAQGPQGVAGADGANGAQGPQGVAGADGANGADGYLSDGATLGNTPYWDGGQWVLDSSNLYNNGVAVGVGTATPADCAALEVASTTRGFLPPRLTTAQRDAIDSPEEGLMVYNLENRGVEVFIPTIGTQQVMASQTSTTHGGGGSSHWQSFTATFNGRLDSIDVEHSYPNTSSDTVVHLEVYRGEGVGGLLLGTASNTNTVNTSTGDKFYTYNFENVEFVQGEKYTWRIYFTTSQNIGWIGFSASNPYSGGVGYYCCNDYTNDDFVFKIKAKEVTPNWVQF